MSHAENAVKNLSQMTPQQEDAIIHTRITNDEKALRRVTKKFHSYTSVAYSPGVSQPEGTSTSVDDAREAFLIELSSFHLSLKKNLMVCEAEARQVEEYQRERERIAQEQTKLREEIEELKISLEQAQLERKRKIEYDVIAEKINALPSREELEQSILSLESDMAAIRAEHENQYRTIQAQKTKLDIVVGDLQELRLLGKPELELHEGGDSGANGAEGEIEAGEASRGGTPAVPEEGAIDTEMADATSSGKKREREETGELPEEEKEEGEEEEEPATAANKNAVDSDEDDVPLAKSLALNPGARPFVPRSSSSRPSTPRPAPVTSLPSSLSKREDGEEEDIEMGEVSEEPKNGKKVKAEPEELEEGEASDFSSELSDPPDD